MAEKEYISREAAIERLAKLMKLQASTARAIIEAIPAADVRPVVRGSGLTISKGDGSTLNAPNVKPSMMSGQITAPAAGLI